MRRGLVVVVVAACGGGAETRCERTGECVTITTPAPVAVDPPLAAASGFTPPVARPLAISSTFGPRFKASERREDFHLGIDYFGQRGDGLLAIGPGTVYGVYAEGSEVYPGGGNVVVIEHAIAARPFHGVDIDRFYAVYLHAETIDVTAGELVAAGQRIGTMGDSGTTDFVHLHFETRVGTVCSLPYQTAHPESACVTGFDPHVHPYLFVGGEDLDAFTVEELPGPSEALAVRYTATRGDLDLDAIDTDLGVLDFITRDGLDARSLETLDDFAYDWLRLVPGDIGSQGETFTIELRFPRRPAFLELRDIHGRGVRFDP